ncbi:MAG TPA: RluA family pseudouridine synthase, partial [Candidatus Poseidoniaceae archaeon]|nr:RluA family pseudouridine synthase [Candidatus Poseidoniaceae archaeon]
LLVIYMRHKVTEDGLLISELSLIFPNMSKNKIRKMLTNNRIEVDGDVVNKAKKEIFAGSLIVIKDKINISTKTVKEKLDIIFEDDVLIVVNKPNKLLSVATNKLEKETMHSMVLDYLKSKDSKSWGWIVHRLDKDTSGVMIFAKSEEVKLILQKQFSENIVKRIYIAIVDGKPYKETGRIENYIAEGKSLIVRECKKTVRGARIAITNWKVLKNKKSHSLLELLIETGRRNQIRVHLAGIKCPVSGDKKYGSVTDPLNRLCLHAEQLIIKHPISLKKIKFSSKSVFNNFFN